MPRRSILSASEQARLLAPADDPQVAIAVVVENDGGHRQLAVGNQIAAPIGRQVLEAVLGK